MITQAHNYVYESRVIPECRELMSAMLMEE